MDFPFQLFQLTIINREMRREIMIHRLFLIHSTMIWTFTPPAFKLESVFFPPHAPCDLSELLFDLVTQSDWINQKKFTDLKSEEVIKSVARKKTCQPSSYRDDVRCCLIKSRSYILKMIAKGTINGGSTSQYQQMFPM